MVFIDTLFVVVWLTVRLYVIVCGFDHVMVANTSHPELGFLFLILAGTVMYHLRFPEGILLTLSCVPHAGLKHPIEFVRNLFRNCTFLTEVHHQGMGSTRLQAKCSPGSEDAPISARAWVLGFIP